MNEFEAIKSIEDLPESFRRSGVAKFRKIGSLHI